MRRRCRGLALGLLLSLALPVCAGDAPAQVGTDADVVLMPAGTRSGLEIYRRFREGLADPTCPADASTRWKTHFSHAPGQLAQRNGDILPLFGYVVDALRAAHLPTEFALIPFVESGYKPAARSPQGPAGMWQMIAVTARNHKVPMRAGYDGRLSPVDSTTAAVRYLKTLYGMFAGDWRLAVMAYNAGEYRIFGALKRGGQTARDASPEALPGLPAITHAYVRKLHALSCLMEQADDREEWLRALDRPVPVLHAVTVPEGTTDIATWAHRNGQDARQLQRLNPAFVGGRITRDGNRPPRLLAFAPGASPPVGTPTAAGAVDTSEPRTLALAMPDEPGPGAVAHGAPPADPAPAHPEAVSAPADAAATPRRHTVVRGDSPWKIAARYGVRVADLLQRNGLGPQAVLRPGKVLLIDADILAGDAGKASTP